MGRRRRAISLTSAALSAAVATAAILATLAAASAHALSFEPFQLTGTSESDPWGMVRAELFEDGAAIVAHQRGEDPAYFADVALRAPGRPIAPARPLTSAAMDDYDVAAGGRTGVVAWTDRQQAVAARVEPGGTLGAPVPIGRANFVDAEMNARGDAIVSIESVFGPDHVKLAVWPRGRAGFGPVQDLGAYAGARHSAILPTHPGFVVAWLACEPHGSRQDGCSRGVVRAVVVRRGGRFGPVRTVGPARWNAELRLVEHGAGGALLVWSNRGRGGSVRAAVLASGGARFGPARALSRPGATGYSAEVAANRRGEGVVTWVERGGGERAAARGRGGSRGARTAEPAGDAGVRARPAAPFRRVGRIHAAVVDRDGRFSPLRTMSAPGVDARAPRVRINGAGEVLLAWSSGPRWWVRTRLAGGPFGRAHSMPATPRPWQAGLALDRDGAAVAVYRRRDGVEAATWPVGTAPRPRRLDTGAVSVPPLLAANRVGDVLAAWPRGARGDEAVEVRVAVQRSRGGFDPPVTAGTFDGWELFPRLNDRGDVLIATSGNAGEDYGIGALVGTIR